MGEATLLLLLQRYLEAIEARGYLAAIQAALPHYRVEDLIAAMQFAPDSAGLFREAARRLGI